MVEKKKKTNILFYSPRQKTDEQAGNPTSKQKESFQTWKLIIPNRFSRGLSITKQDKPDGIKGGK